MGNSAPIRRKRVLLKRVCSIFDKINAYTDKTYWQPMTPILCDLVCLRAAGWSTLDYETLLTVSGFGPSFAYKPIKHPPLNDYAFCLPPEGFERRVTAVTGAVWEHLRYTTPEGFWRALKRSIDSGAPARVSWMEEAILAGYHDADEKRNRKAFVLCEPFTKPGTWWSWDEFANWFKSPCCGGRLSRLKKKVRTGPARQTAVDVLRTFVQLAKADPRGRSPEFVNVKTGLAGIAAYADDIAQGEQIGGGWRGCHCAYPQISGRPSAAKYLATLGESNLLRKAASSRLLAAAEHYAAATAAWGQWGKHLGHPAPRNAWDTKKHRLAGASAICEALKQETLAIDEIEKALATLAE